MTYSTAPVPKKPCSRCTLMIATPASKRTSSASAANCAIPGVWHVALLPASSGPAHANARGGVSTRLHPRQNTGCSSRTGREGRGRGAAGLQRAHAGNATEQRAMLGECAARTRTWAHAFVGRRREAIRRHGQQRAAEAGAEHMLSAPPRSLVCARASPLRSSPPGTRGAPPIPGPGPPGSAHATRSAVRASRRPCTRAASRRPACPPHAPGRRPASPGAF